MDLEKQLYKLCEIGIALSGQRDLNKLLEKILTEARAFTNAEGASLYIKEEDSLRFVVSQNEVLAQRHPDKSKFVFSTQKLPLAPNSMAGYVALSGKVLNIEDAYSLPTDSPYQINRKFDRENDYRTRSMLLVPMRDINDQVLGVLALINARSSDNRVIAFDSRYENLVQSLASQAAVAYTNAELTQKLKDAYLDTVLRLSMAAECREPDIAAHLQRISCYSAVLAEQLGLPLQQVEHIRYASPMHDVGKIGIPDAILYKPGGLDDEEYEIMKTHTLYGGRILSNSHSDILKLSEEIALTHHEYYNGEGYPRGLRGEEIPISGRIVALADVFDALASKRCYKDSWQMDDIVAYIEERAGNQFDPQVVCAFKERLPDFLEINRRYNSLNSPQLSYFGNVIS